MPELTKRLILANGEKYHEAITKKSGWGETQMPRSYSDARDLVKREISQTLTRVAALPSQKRLKDEIVLSMRLHPDMTAKTYDPKGIFLGDLENVGSRNYATSVRSVATTKRIQKLAAQVQEVTGRLIFVRGNESGFRHLLRELDVAERSLNDQFKKSIQRIEHFNLLDPSEQILGFPQDWKEGRVEIVLHPSQYSQTEQTTFLKELFSDYAVNWNETRVALYPNGPLFLSCRIARNALEALAGSNPLRTVHPLVFGGIEDLRGAPSFAAPPPPSSATRSTIKIGMFDGGIDPNHPWLKGFVEQDESLSIKTPQLPEYTSHGIAVAGAILYGPLNERDSKTPLSIPPVSVVSIRALPTSNPKDIDLYESIDVIETAVPARQDINTYNISFGPRGPILDDSISRFTYTLDALAVAHKVTFYVAVGNDGEAGEGLDRIQSPSDLVNGIGVGAFTYRKGKAVHAPYSCKGPGRECGKIKPDFAAFGGCDQTPIHLLSAQAGNKILSQGTSFASPIGAALGGQSVQSFDRGTSILGRALLIHAAKHPENKPDHLLGHGLIPQNLDDILRCDDKDVTIVFQGDIIPKKMIRLPLMLPAGLEISGKVQITWTIAALPSVNPNHPSDYTSCCIEDIFYPDKNKYRFSNPDKSSSPKHKDYDLISDSKAIRDILAQKWIQSDLPVSKTGNQYKSEQERRSLDCKWEPIVRRKISMFGASLNEPALILHAIPRNGAADRISYAAVVTISAKSFTGDLYGAVLKRYPALQPIRLRTEAELRVQI